MRNEVALAQAKATLASRELQRRRPEVHRLLQRLGQAVASTVTRRPEPRGRGSRKGSARDERSWDVRRGLPGGAR